MRMRWLSAGTAAIVASGLMIGLVPAINGDAMAAAPSAPVAASSAQRGTAAEPVNYGYYGYYHRPWGWYPPYYYYGPRVIYRPAPYYYYPPPYYYGPAYYYGP